MTRVLAEILLRSLRGRFVRWFRRLRQPRYLIAFLAGLAYFGFVLSQRFTFGARTGGQPWETGAATTLPSEAATLALALVGAFFLTLTWVFSSAKAALPLTEAEIDFLLPAPLTRRQVLSFVLLRTQVGLLFGSFLLTLFTSGGDIGHRLLRWAGVWGCLTLFHLHHRGVQLWKARNTELPPARANLRRGLAVAAALLFWGGIAVCLARAYTSMGSLADLQDYRDVAAALRSFAGELKAGPLDEILTPLTWLALAATGNITLGLGAFLALVLALHWEWVVRSAARFEDATLERARRQRTRGVRQGGAYAGTSQRRREREPFSLARPGAPELALYWKNLLGVSRTPLRRQLSWLGIFAGALFAAVFVLSPPAPFLTAALGTGAMMTAVFSIFAGLWLRNDLRQDLLHLEILRPWPIPGHRLVAAELLAPATQALKVVTVGLVLAGAGLSGLAAAGRLKGALGTLAGGAPGIAALVLAAALLAVPVTLVSLALQNVAALGLPSWIPLGSQRRRGAAMTGQNVLLFLAHVLALALATLPGALLVAGILFVQMASGLSFHVLELPLLALVGSLSLWFVLWILVRLGGSMWERLDPSQEMLSTGE